MIITGTEIRAVVESQFLSMRVHSESIGISTVSRIFATGGASRNQAIIQTMADVFGVPVFTHSQPNSACLGAAYRAFHGWRNANDGKSNSNSNNNSNNRKEFIAFQDAVTGPLPFTKQADPDPNSHQVYEAMLKRYKQLEQKIATD